MMADPTSSIPAAAPAAPAALAAAPAALAAAPAVIVAPVAWRQLPEALARFEENFMGKCRYEVATAGQEAGWAVVFSMGTVARVNLAEPGAEFQGFLGPAGYRPPPQVVRDPARAEERRRENQAAWEALPAMWGGDAGAAVRRAYLELARAGYPANGDPRLRVVADPLDGGPSSREARRARADRERAGAAPDAGSDPGPVLAPPPARLEDSLWLVAWPEYESADRLLSLALEPSAERAEMTAVRLRRLDYAFPRVAAVFGPDCRPVPPRASAPAAPTEPGAVPHQGPGLCPGGGRGLAQSG
jgi:hypothetical protein